MDKSNKNLKYKMYCRFQNKNQLLKWNSMIITILSDLIKISKKVPIAQFLRGVSCIQFRKEIKDQIVL